jgi:hypothetical protein
MHLLRPIDLFLAGCNARSKLAAAKRRFKFMFTFFINLSTSMFSLIIR